MFGRSGPHMLEMPKEGELLWSGEDSTLQALHGTHAAQPSQASKRLDPKAFLAGLSGRRLVPAAARLCAALPEGRQFKWSLHMMG